MDKSPDAFRTISEVAEWLDTPAHVLRFWESRFSQVKPVKRAGGRRYYRPSDMLLLGGIKKLLHEDGMTIRGVQKLLREEGIKHVSGFSAPIDGQPDSIQATGSAIHNTDDEAPIQIDVPQDPIDNVVSIAPTQDDASDLAEPVSETEDEADQSDLLRMDGQTEAELDTEALFAHSLDETPAPTDDAADAPAGNGQEPMLPFGRGRVHPDEATGPIPDPEATPPTSQPVVQTTAIALGAHIPDDPEDADLHTDVIPAGHALAASLRTQRNAGQNHPADQLAQLYARLTALRDRMDRD